MKSLLKSKTVLGILISLAAKVLGIDSAEAGDLLHKLTELWPVLLGIFADLGALWTRINTFDFDKSIFRSRTFWLQIISAVSTAVAAFGVDVSGLDAIAAKALDSLPSCIALAASAWAIIGRFMASQRIEIEKTRPV